MLTLRAFGRTVQIHAADGRLESLVRSAFAEAWSATEGVARARRYSLDRQPGPGQVWRVAADGVEVASSETEQQAIEALVADAELWLASTCDDPVFVHAGAVAMNGVGLLIPGPSGSGKTTMVSRLIEEGAEYFSDDYALIGRDGHLHPYRCDLMIRERPGERRRRNVSTLRPAPSPVPIGLVLGAGFLRDADWLPMPTSRGDSLLSLLQNTPSARSQPAVVLPVLEHALRGARGLRGFWGDASIVVRWLGANPPSVGPSSPSA